jgi:membrane fusion protein, multidrug efflux system
MRDGKYNIVCIFMILCMLAVTGCGKQAEKETKAPMVKSQTISLGDNGDLSTYAGSVHGRYESNLSFQVGGKILSRNVQLGDRVQAGDTLMIVDAKDVVQTVNKSDAQVEEARAQMSLAQANLNRYSQLYAQEAIPAATLDQYQTSYDAAFASYQQALAQSVQGHNSLEYTNLTADGDGVISAVNGEVGQVVAAGQTVLTLVHSDELEVEIDIPENRVQDMTIGKTVAVSFWALGNSRIDGVVREVAPMADKTARTYKVRISLPQPPADVRLGMTASVICSASDKKLAPDTVLLPLSAIYQTGDTPQVWVVGEDMTVSLKTIKVESFGDNEVKATGLANGDIVVTAGVHRLYNGEKVRLTAGEDA